MSNASAQVLSQQKISNEAGGMGAFFFSGNSAALGESLTALGDLDGDGLPDIATSTVGNGGQVRILRLNSDGTVKSATTIVGGLDGVPTGFTRFGSGLAGIGDLDRDGVPDMAVGDPVDGGGCFFYCKGVVWILFLNSDGTVKGFQKITEGVGGFTGTLEAEGFGLSIAGVGDLDQDGTADLAVGAPGAGSGAVYILFLNPDGTVDRHQKISSTDGAFPGDLDEGDFFGWRVALVSDINADGLPDLAVGALSDDDGSPDLGNNLGAAWILRLRSNGTVSDVSKISATSGGLPLTPQFDAELAYVGFAGDIDSDGRGDLLLGAPAPGEWGPYGILFAISLSAAGEVGAADVITSNMGGFTGSIAEGDRFGTSPTVIGDLDGDGRAEIAVGQSSADEGSFSFSGAIWILFTSYDVSTAVNAEGIDRMIPRQARLEQTHPNPFSGTTTIRYSLQRATDSQLRVHDLLGRTIEQLHSGPLPPGTYDVSFDATGLPSGIYYYRLQAGDYVETRRMVVVK